jgi:hypothetical protein
MLTGAHGTLPLSRSNHSSVGPFCSRSFKSGSNASLFCSRSAKLQTRASAPKLGQLSGVSQVTPLCRIVLKARCGGDGAGHKLIVEYSFAIKSLLEDYNRCLGPFFVTLRVRFCTQSIIAVLNRYNSAK